MSDFTEKISKVTTRKESYKKDSRRISFKSEIAERELLELLQREKS